MIENGLYVVKSDILKIISSLGGDCDLLNGHKRPVFCCVRDSKIDGLYWAIPTSDISHRDKKQLQKYIRYMNLPEKDLRSCYYHTAKTTKDALYKISSCYPIIDKYVDHEFISNNHHVIMRKQRDIEEIHRKFKRILAMEFRKPNYFPQHITDIRNYLIEELKKIKSLDESAATDEESRKK